MSALRRILPLLVAVGVLAPTLAFAWPHSPTQNVPIGFFASTPMLAADGAGGAFVAYYQWNASIDVYVQHYDANGAPLWAAGGVPLCNAADAQYPQGIVNDGAGGVIVTWQDLRLGAGNPDLYAQRVNAAGAPLWTANGVNLCNATGTQSNSHMAADRNGGAYVVWTDQRNSFLTGLDVYLQHVTGSGVLQMGPSGAAVSTAVNDQSWPRVAVDDFNAYVVWSDGRAGADDIYVQKFDNFGGAYWGASGFVLCNAPGFQVLPQVEAPLDGSLIVAWTDSRSSTGDIYAQRVDTYTGSSVWTANGIPVCDAGGTQQFVSMALDLQGGVVMGWQDGRNAPLIGIYAQRLDLTGVPSWTTNGNLVCSSGANSGGPRVVSDGFGGALLSWTDTRYDQGNVWAQRLNSYGYPAWNAANGVPVSTAQGTQGVSQIASTPTGGAWMVWHDNRITGTSYGYMQMVDRWGYLGAEPVMAGVGDVPNDQGGKVRVAWYASPLDLDPLFNNVTTYTVFRSVPAPLAVALEKAAPLESAAPFTALGGRTFRRFSSDATTEYFWEEVARVAARHLATYSAIVPTAGDSVAGSNPRTSFLVMAETLYGSSWWTSASDSAYSVDNLAPAAPAPFTGQFALAGTRLHWDPNAEPDLASYRLYRGTAPSFTPGAGSLVATVPDTGYVDAAGRPYYYKLTAVDSHGNESPAALLLPAGTLAAEDATAELAFRAPTPNPASRATTLRFALPRAGAVRLAVYDAAGRLVRTLAGGERAAGEHAVTWDLRDDAGHAVGAGLYFARFEAGEQVLVRRVAVTH